MNTLGEGELYEALLRLELLEEVLELLDERDLTSLEELAAELANEVGNEEILHCVAGLVSRGLRTAEDVERELATLEQAIEEPGTPESRWLSAN